MKIHDLKISWAYLEAIQSGRKKCEVRYNDRDFQKWDHIKFFVLIGKDGEVDKSVSHGPFLITHVLSFVGLREWYVCLSIEPTIRHVDYTPRATVAHEEDVPF